MTDGVVALDAADRARIDDAARLHATLLPTSPIARLGSAFMSRFYYRSLVADGLIACVLAYAEGQPAGFIVCTARPSEFMAAGLRRHFVRLSLVLAGQAVADPRRLGVIWWTLRFMRRHRGAPAASGEGEILSFGVLPDYRNPAFIRRTGRRISWELFTKAREYFRDAGLTRFRAVVESANREALMFYLAQGGRAQSRGAAPGTTIVVCEEADAPSRG